MASKIAEWSTVDASRSFERERERKREREREAVIAPRQKQPELMAQ
jgi:hypothetical protein